MLVNLCDKLLSFPYRLKGEHDQLNIVVKSLMEALTGDDILDLIEESAEVDPDNGEVDPEIAIQFPRAPHVTPLAESPPPPPMMAEDRPPAV